MADLHDPSKFGKSEGIADIKKYIDAYQRVQSGLDIIASKKKPADNEEKLDVTMANTYRLSQKDAFVFNRDIILKVLGDSPLLMVHLAAKFEPGTDAFGDSFAQGNPTIVLLGCSQTSDKTFSSREDTKGNGDDDGAEQPGSTSDGQNTSSQVKLIAGSPNNKVAEKKGNEEKTVAKAKAANANAVKAKKEVLVFTIK